MLPLLPLIAGLSHTLLDVGGFGIGVACTMAAAPILWLLGLLREGTDSIALSLAYLLCGGAICVGGGGSSDGAAPLLQMRCSSASASLLPGLVAFIYCSRGVRADTVQGRCDISRRPYKMDPEGRLARRLRDGEKWVIVKRRRGPASSGRSCVSKLAACLCSFPGGESAGARRASARAVAKLYAMMVLVPGSAAPSIRAEHFVRGSRGALNVPWWRTGAGAWAAFAFVKFAFVVFALLRGGLGTAAGLAPRVDGAS